MVIATWGNTTFTAAMEAGLNISVFGPSQSFTSMPMAIDAFLEKVKK